MFAQGSPPEWDDRKTETTRFDRIVRSAFVTHGNFPSSPDVYDGRWEIAEALYIHITEGYGGTPAAVAAQVRLSAPPRDRLERTSRVELPVFGTLYGFWLGIAVPAALGADGPEAYGAGLLIGGPVGLFASRAMAHSGSTRISCLVASHNEGSTPSIVSFAPAALYSSSASAGPWISATDSTYRPTPQLRTCMLHQAAMKESRSNPRPILRDSGVELAGGFLGHPAGCA
ncbi:MAG: hypothetical protein IH968_16765 [Gemmatimonadetes bacterium]|nr:hypothetical protein [Gemmatimonadota bacterium]